ncbi:ATP-binding protein [Pseudogemmobacter sp. W21_MBD1_M6]|uniref:ATP-binding protein n=1 Tax=Pseudogemmobacter sp. W21_MBD1_M6 TaxID=3240271 RepID=UPI003F991F94
MKPKRSLLWLQAITLIICLGLSFVSFRFVHWLAQIRSHENFEVLIDQGLASLDRRFDVYERTLDGLAGLFIASDMVTATHMSDYAAMIGIGKDMSDVSAIGFATSFTASDAALSRGPAGEDARGPDAFALRDRNDRRIIVQYIAPQAHHESILGLDFAANAALMSAAKAAQAARKTSLVPHFALGAGDGTLSEAMLLKPVYRPTRATGASGDGQEVFVGFAFVILDLGKAFDTLTAAQNSLIELDVWVGAPEPLAVPVYETARPLAPAFAEVQEVRKFGQALTLSWQSTPRFDSIQPFRARWVILVLGLLVTALVSALLHIVLRRERAIATLVAQKSRELETRQTERRSIIENAMLAILSVGPRGVILHSNAAAQQLLMPHDSATDLTGMTIADVLPALDLDRGDGRFKLAVPPAPAGDGPLIIEIEKNTWVTSEGETRITLLLRDITASEQYAMEIAKTEQRWNLALMGAKIGVFDVDLRRQTSVVSEMWYKIMKIDAQSGCPDPYGTLMDRVHPDDRVILRDAQTACVEGVQTRADVRFRIMIADDDWRWIQSDGVVVERAESGRALRMIGTQMDITESIRLDRMKREFVATVSHELRTPLTSIKGALGLLQVRAKDAEPRVTQRLIQIALSNSDRLAGLLNDILDMEKINAGSMTLDPKAENLGRIMALASDQVGPYASQWDVDLEVVAPEDDAHIWTDQKRVIQVLTNLLSNACKFAHEGTTVRLTAEVLPSHVRISVSNVGPGIPEEFRSRIFHPFSQADSSDTRQKGGTGLGLNISRQLTEAMGGTIGYDSEPDKETVFWFTCPLAGRPDGPRADATY